MRDSLLHSEGEVTLFSLTTVYADLHSRLTGKALLCSGLNWWMVIGAVCHWEYMSSVIWMRMSREVVQVCISGRWEMVKVGLG